MKGRTIRGCMSGEFRHIPNKPKTFGWLNDFILTHSSMKLFMSFVECISECVGWEKGEFHHICNRSGYVKITAYRFQDIVIYDPYSVISERIITPVILLHPLSLIFLSPYFARIFDSNLWLKIHFFTLVLRVPAEF